MQLAKSIGKSKARVVVARKLAIILQCMWRTGERFRWESSIEVTA